MNTRIKKLEDVIKPNKPHCILAFGREDADKKMLKYQETYPGSVEPTVLMVKFIASPASSER
jgi:hypothetical protein